MSSGDLLLRQIEVARTKLEVARAKLEDDIKTERKLKEERLQHQEKWNCIKLTVALLAIVATSAPLMWPPAATASVVMIGIALVCEICDWNTQLP